MQSPDDARRIFLPLLDSPAANATAMAVVDGGRGGASFPKVIEPQQPPPPNGVAERESRRINKYVLAGAVLASTNSILLGYG